MKLAVNYSPAALQLRNQGRLPADLLKCPDWPDHWDEFAQAGPVYIHFRHMAAAGRLQNTNWDQTARLRALSGSPFVNLHIAPYVHWLSGKEPSPAELFSMARADIENAARRFGAEKVIIENAPYRDAIGTQARAAVDPMFLSRLVDETGCGFLLDLSHARISARQLELPEEEYVMAMPLHRLRELHITGLSEENGILVDHYPMREEDWLAAEWALRNIRAGRWSEPWVMTFEYGGVGPGYEERTDPAVIEEQVKQFDQMRRNG